MAGAMKPAKRLKCPLYMSEKLQFTLYMLFTGTRQGLEQQDIT